MLVLIELELRKQGYNRSNQKRVAVISFYGHQIFEIKRAIQEESKSIGKFTAIRLHVNSVDQFQGQERPIVIVSMVRCPRQHDRPGKKSNIAKFERINVAFSRAQELLVVVGSRGTFERFPVELSDLNCTNKKEEYVYRKIIAELWRKGCVFISGDILLQRDYPMSKGKDIVQKSKPFDRTKHNRNRRK